MAAPDMEVIKDIPGYKVILKAVLKSQIQQLVEQLASTTEEESVILTASVADGTLCHLGSNSGRVFLEDHEDIKSQFLGFCLKRHHKKKQEMEKQEELDREEALARSMQAVPPPRYGGVGNRMGFVPHRSPRYMPPHQPLHPVSISRASGRMRSPANRHQPYAMIRPPRVSAGPDEQGLSPGKSQRPVPSPNAGRLPVSNKVDGQQVIKIEPKEDNEDNSNESVNDSVSIPTSTGAITDSSLPPSPSIKPPTPSQSQGPSGMNNNDDNLEPGTSAIPNETSELGFSDSAPPGGLSLDSDLSNILSMSSSVADSNVQQSTSADGLTNQQPHNTSTELDPNVSVKLESPVDDSEMDLEITGVELGQRQPVQEPMSSQDWMVNVQNVMQGATGSPADMAGQQGYTDNHYTYRKELISSRMYVCEFCHKPFPDNWKLQSHRTKHTGEKPYVCDTCGKAFKAKRSLQGHQLQHQKVSL